MWSQPAIGAVLIAIAALCAYHRVYSTPFLFDDYGSIVNNTSIRKLWPLWSAFSPPTDGSGVTGRPLVNFSFALNYAVGGLRVEGYHAVNVALHIVSGWLLFGLVRRSLEQMGRAGHIAVSNPRFPLSRPPVFALAVALIWTVHPLQTESVTCVAQRTELLGGLFYLLTLYCFARRIDAASGGWAVAAIFACLLGMFSKEILVSAPLMVMLYDRTFVAGSFAAAWRRRRGFYLGLAATWIPLVALVVISGGSRSDAAGFGLGVSWHAYALKQCEAISRYLQLALWPHPLVLDYGADVTVDPGRIVGQALVVLVLVGATVFALWRRPAAGFLGAFFLCILAPSSSVVPLVSQTMAEHRMYLPLAAVAVLAVSALATWGRSIGVGVYGLLVVTLGFVTDRRNADYRSELVLWADTAAKWPGNPRAHSNLGLELAKIPGRTAEALAAYERALSLRADDPSAHYNIANELAKLPNRQVDAIAHYEAALRINRNSAEVHNNLGLLLAGLPGRAVEAGAHLEEAVRLKPNDARLHNNLGMVLATIPWRSIEAPAEYERALRIDPSYAEAYFNLGVVLAATSGRTPEALAHYEEAIRLRPDYVEAHYNLAVEQAKIPARRRDAILHFERAVALNPNVPEAHNNLAIQYAIDGRPGDAIRHFEFALQLNPNFEGARENLKLMQGARKN